MQQKRWKKQVLDILAKTAFATGISHPDKSSSAVIVTFHRILPEELKRLYPYPKLVVTPEELCWCMDYFNRHYRIMTVSDLIAAETGIAAKPLLAVSFDDGQLDNYQFAAPSLEGSNTKATFYIPTHAIDSQRLLWHDILGFSLLAAKSNKKLNGTISGIISELRINLDFSNVETAVEQCKVLSADVRHKLINSLSSLQEIYIPEWANMMNWEQIKILAKDGHEIGSHSIMHNLLPQLSDAEIEKEIIDSKLLIEQKIGRSVLSFCYPNGNFDARCKKAVILAGYKNAVTTGRGAIKFKKTNVAVPRCNICIEHQLNAAGRLTYPLLAFRLSVLHPAKWR